MAFGDFDLRTAVQKFDLTEDPRTDLFQDIGPLEPSAVLRDWLAKFAPVALGVGSEQARRELIIAPVLADAKRKADKEVNFLPGVAFDVDREQGLTGSCDYLLIASSQLYYVRAPILAVVEAKEDDIIGGLGQCVAEMVAIRLFNERDGTPIPAVFGCVTSGSLWRFLKLEGSTVFIDLPEYYLHDVSKILGILVTIARS